MNSFQELNLPKSLDRAIAGMNFTTPTPIQAQSIPVALSGRDILACAQTGSGKTAAFAIPILSKLLEKPDQTMLILVPTRELSTQVTDVFRQLCFHAPSLRVVSLIGGVSMQPQLRALSKGYHVIVATPGRLVDHLERKSVSLQKLSMLVLDEADRMLDMGFAPQLKQIFRFLPKERQTLLFSATLPAHIQEMANTLLKNPARISIGAISSAVPTIQQSTKHVIQTEKNGAILDEINTRQGSILIFGRTQRRVDRLAKYLASYGVDTGRIHGGRTQGQRNRALDDFRTEKTRVLVATDIAARGIDIDHVAHVINYDLPQVAEDYVHRIGRTARAGRKGEALSLISAEEKPLWKEIEKLLKSKPGASPQKRAMDTEAQGKATRPRIQPAQ